MDTTNEERAVRPISRRLRTISGIFEHTAGEVQQSASDFRKTVMVPVYEDSKKYMDDKPVQATLLAIFTILSFLPILVFIAFVVSSVLLVTFSAVSAAFGASTVAIVGGAVILLGFVGVCIAPATLALTMMLLTIQGLHRLLHMVVDRIGTVLPALKTRLTLVFGRE